MSHHVKILRKLVLPVIILLVGANCFLLNIRAQDPVYSHFMFNQLNFNPAFSGNTPYTRLITGYRNQWPGLGNAFVNYYASVDLYVKPLGGGVGLGIDRDIQGDGIFSKTSFNLMYSYPVKISYDIAANFGIQGGVVQKNLDGTRAVFGDQNPYENNTTAEAIPNASKFFPDFSAGASFLFYEQYQFNFSVHHLSRPDEGLGTGNPFVSPLRFSAQFLTQFPKYKIGAEKPRKTLFWRPGIMAQVQKTTNLIGWGTNILYSQFTAGVWIRNNMSFTLNTASLLAGYTYSGVSIYYSYDAWFPGNGQQMKNFGAHEVTFIYLFQYNDPRKKMKPIKCPKI